MLKKILLIALCFLSIGVKAELYTGGVADVTNGLIAHWKLDEMSYNGTAGEVKDSSGNGNNGTSYGKVITNPGKIGRSAYFNGIGTMIEINKSAELHLSQDWSLSLWIKSTSEEYGRRAISNRGIGDGGSVFDVHVANPQAFIDYYGTAQTGIYVPEDISNRWECVTIIISAGSRSYYVNGIRTDFTDYPYVYDGNLQPIRIGDWYPPENSDNFIGSIDDVRIYNRAITPDEVSRLYLLGSEQKKETVVYQSNTTPYENLPTNGLIAHWKLDELSYNGTSGEVKDSSGNGKHGISYKKVITNPGQIKRAAYFDGSGASIYRGDIYLPTNNTMSGWVKIPRIVDGSLLFGYESGCWPACSFYVSAEPNLLRFKRWDYVSNPEAVNGSHIDVVDGIDTNMWYFLAVTSTNFISTVYLNGIDVGFVNYETYEFALTYLSIGSFLEWNWNAGESIVDDVRIYDRALSASEIKALYNAKPVEEHVAAVYADNVLVSNPLKKDYSKTKYQNVTNGLMAWWKLDELSYNGTVGEVNDSSGNGYNGVVEGKVITNPSRLGRAGYFDGSCWIDTELVSNLNSFSVAMWLKPSDVARVQLTASRRYGINSWQFGQDGDKLLFSVWQSSGVPVDAERVSSTLSIGKWSFVVGVVDGNYVSVFIDGVRSGSPVAYDGTVMQSTVPITIGRYAVNTEYNFDGNLDDVRIYNRALTAEEIQILYKYREE